MCARNPNFSQFLYKESKIKLLLQKNMLYICGVKVDQITKTNRIKHNHIPVYTLQHLLEPCREIRLFFLFYDRSICCVNDI